MRLPKIGEEVVVHDRYRFAIPLKATVAELSDSNDGIRVVLLESNNPHYPIGANNVWVSLRQLRGLSKVKGE